MMRRLPPLAIAFFIASSAFGQEAAVKDKAECLGSGVDDTLDKAPKCLSASDLQGKIDLTVPANPLFTLMGTTPETVIKPTPGEQFNVSVLPKVLSALGDDQFAVGFEVRPSQFLVPADFTQAELGGHPDTSDPESVKRAESLKKAKAFFPVTFSLAATQSKETTQVLRIGAGASFIYDPGEPIYGNKWADCFQKAVGSPQDAVQKALEAARIQAIKDLGNPSTPDELAKFDKHVKELTPGASFEAYKAKAKSAQAECIRTTAGWNRPIYGLGVAAYYADIDPPPADPSIVSTVSRHEVGYGVWASGSWPVGPVGGSGQITANLRYNDGLVRQREDKGKKIIETVNLATVGARYTHRIIDTKAANPSNPHVVRAFIEAAWSHEKFGAIDDDYTQAGVGVEVQISKDLYVQAVIGDTFGSVLDRSTYLSGQLKWSFGPAAK